jgi:hypothetical protein
MTLAVTTVAYVFMPQFNEVYSGLRLDLPWQSRLLSEHYKLTAVLSGAVAFAWAAWPDANRRAVVAAAIGLIGAPVLFCFGIWAAYTPIWIAGLDR